MPHGASERDRTADLRVTNALLYQLSHGSLYRNGAEISDISRYLGHSSPAVTLSIYTESLKDNISELADTMADMLAQ